MITRLGLTVVLLSACDSARTLSIDGKSLTIAASAAVADCPKCPACVAPPEPAKSINWIYTGRDAVQPLSADGGSIAVDDPGWDCKYSSIGHLGTGVAASENVELECVLGKAHVKTFIQCNLQQGSVDSVNLGLGRTTVFVTCDAR